MVGAWRRVGGELRGLHSSPVRQDEAKTMAMESKRGWDGEVFMKWIELGNEIDKNYFSFWLGHADAQ